MQETKLADAAAPVAEFHAAGYELAHHGEGQWNGVAIASRVGIADVVTNFGEPLRPAQTSDAGDDEPLAEARMIAATCGGVRVVSLYAPNGRVVDSIFYEAKLRVVRAAGPVARAIDRSGGAARPRRRLQRRARRQGCVGPGQVPWRDPRVAAGAGGVPPVMPLGSGGRLSAASPETGRYTWWDYRAGNFHKNFGMRIDHLLVTKPVADRTVWVEIDREARKGKPIPSDHAPLVMDIDDQGQAFEAGWKDAEARIAARTTGKR